MPSIPLPIVLPPSTPRFSPDLNLSLFRSPSLYQHVRFHLLFLQYSYIPISLFLDYQSAYILRDLDSREGGARLVNPKVSPTGIFYAFLVAWLFSAVIEITRLISIRHNLRPDYQGMGKSYSAPRMIDVYMSPPTRLWVEMRSWEKCCFLETVRKEAWRAHDRTLVGQRGPIGILDDDTEVPYSTGFIQGFTELAYLRYSDGFWVVVALIPRLVINALLLLFFCQLSPLYHIDAPRVRDPQSLDATYFNVNWYDGYTMSLSRYSAITVFIGFVAYSIVVLVWLISAISVFCLWAFGGIGRREGVGLGGKQKGMRAWVERHANRRIRTLSVLSLKAAPLPSTSQHYLALSRLSSLSSKSARTSQTSFSSRPRLSLTVPNAPISMTPLSPSSQVINSRRLPSRQSTLPGADYYTTLPSATAMSTFLNGRNFSLPDMDRPRTPDRRRTNSDQFVFSDFDGVGYRSVFIPPNVPPPTPVTVNDSDGRETSPSNLSPSSPDMTDSSEGVEDLNASSASVDTFGQSEGGESEADAASRFSFGRLLAPATSLIWPSSKTMPSEAGRRSRSVSTSSNSTVRAQEEAAGGSSIGVDVVDMEFGSASNQQELADLDFESTSINTTTTDDDEERKAWEDFPNPSPHERYLSDRLQDLSDEQRGRSITRRERNEYSELVSSMDLGSNESMDLPQQQRTWSNPISYFFGETGASTTMEPSPSPERRVQNRSQLGSILEETEDEDELFTRTRRNNASRA